MFPTLWQQPWQQLHPSPSGWTGTQTADPTPPTSLQPTHLRREEAFFFVFWKHFLKNHQIWRRVVFTDLDANYYHNHFHHNWNPHLSDSGILFRINETFVVVCKVSCCFRGQFPPSSLPCLLSFSSLCLLLLPWLNIWMQHPLMITQKHCNDSQPASQEHTQRQNKLNLWFPAPRRDTLQYISFFSRSPSQALLNSIYAFSQLFFTLSHFLLFAFCLMCARRLTKDTLPLHPSIFSSLSHSLLPCCLP